MSSRCLTARRPSAAWAGWPGRREHGFRGASAECAGQPSSCAVTMSFSAAQVVMSRRSIAAAIRSGNWPGVQRGRPHVRHPGLRVGRLISCWRSSHPPAVRERLEPLGTRTSPPAWSPYVEQLSTPSSMFPGVEGARIVGEIRRLTSWHRVRERANLRRFRGMSAFAHRGQWRTFRRPVHGPVRVVSLDWCHFSPNA